MFSWLWKGLCALCDYYYQKKKKEILAGNSYNTEYEQNTLLVSGELLAK